MNVQGLSQVSEQQVRSKIEVQPGQSYNPSAVARDIRRLYDLGFFSHIEADTEVEGDGVSLSYSFTEKRIIDEIRLLGNKKIKARQLRGVLSWKEGDAFVPDAYDDERVAILKLYQTKGYPNASVDINVEEVGPARVRVVYTINEGTKARVRSITFVGNQAMTSHQLRKVMKTKPAWWFVGGKFDEAKLENDIQEIVNAYGDKGRLEAAVAHTNIQQADGSKGVDITIEIAEGPEYHVETLDVADNTVFDDTEVDALVKVKPNDVHNKTQVEDDASLVQKGYWDSGYVNARVTPQVTLDRDKKTTHIVHRVEEGDLKYVEEIKISGNNVTKDEVIRREMMVKPGDRFDGPAIKATEQSLNNTRYFEKIRITLEDPTKDDPFANLLVDVEEAKTGEFTVGAGYSTEEGIGGYTSVRLSNFDITNWPTFSGGGQQFNARINIGEKRNEFNVGWMDPEFLGHPIGVGFDLFNESYKYSDGTDFTEHTRGGQIRAMKNLSPFVTARAALRYRDMDVTDIPFFAAPELRRERGGSTTISTIWGINRNTLDDRNEPNSGSRHDLQLEFAGLGGDNDFWKLDHESQWYFTLSNTKKWVLSFRTREGYADSYGGSDFVPITDRYFAGGTTTVRGYESQAIGPRVRKYSLFGDWVSVGGDMRVLENLEVRYKLSERFRFYSFLDAGGVWRDSGDFDFGDIKYGTGVGVGVNIPRLGPIRVDYAVPLNPDEDQGSGRLHLTTGFRF